MAGGKDSASLRREAEQKLKAAVAAGRMDEVIRLATAVREYDSALRVLQRSAERVSAELKGPEQADDSMESATTLHATAIQPALSKNARGKLRRAEYIRKLAAKGVALHHTKGRLYETDSGKGVGIAYASEVSPDKWWMGLPDQHFDVVVLLCESRSNQVLDFVLPPALVAKMWPLLSRHANQREMHVQRTGVNYELEPGRGLGKINQYQSSITELR